MKITLHKAMCPLGTLVLARNEEAFFFLGINTLPRERFLARYLPGYALDPTLYPINEQLQKALHEFFQGKPLTFSGPLCILGTPFQKRVYEETRTIPHGETLCYGELGRRLGTKGYRAIGAALKANPLPLIIPCHRVVGVEDLGGFAYGTSMKKLLLEIEKPFSALDGFA